jgi:hypothetical protein
MADKPTEPVDVREVIAFMIDQTAAFAWQKMGLQPDMATGAIHRDLAQARIAIDATAALCGVLEPNLDEDDRRQLQNLVRDLRVNFVEKSSEAAQA